jgi:hypothetical protein
MPSMISNARLYVSHRGPQHPFEYAGVISDSLNRYPQCDGEMPLKLSAGAA